MTNPDDFKKTVNAFVMYFEKLFDHYWYETQPAIKGLNPYESPSPFSIRFHPPEEFKPWSLYDEFMESYRTLCSRLEETEASPSIEKIVVNGITNSAVAINHSNAANLSDAELMNIHHARADVYASALKDSEKKVKALKSELKKKEALLKSKDELIAEHNTTITDLKQKLLKL